MTSVATLSLDEASSRGGFARRLVLRELRRMRHSQLRLTLPTGETLVLGNQAFTGQPAEIHLSDENFFRRIVLASDIGLTESYMDGEWDSPDLRAVIGFFIENVDHTPGMSGSAARGAALGLLRIADRIGKQIRRQHQRHHEYKRRRQRPPHIRRHRCYSLDLESCHVSRIVA